MGPDLGCAGSPRICPRRGFGASACWPGNSWVPSHFWGLPAAHLCMATLPALDLVTWCSSWWRVAGGGQPCNGGVCAASVCLSQAGGHAWVGASWWRWWEDRRPLNQGLQIIRSQTLHTCTSPGDILQKVLVREWLGSFPGDSTPQVTCSPGDAAPCDLVPQVT